MTCKGIQGLIVKIDYIIIIVKTINYFLVCYFFVVERGVYIVREIP